MSKLNVRVAGVEYEIPAEQSVLNAAEDASGQSLMGAIAGNRFGGFLQGVIYAGLKELGVKEVAGQPLTYKAIGKACDFGEARDNCLALLHALTPDIPHVGSAG